MDFRGRAAIAGQEEDFRHMELCYMVSMSTLHEVLQSEAKPNTAYRLLASDDTVTVVHYGPEGLINQFAFPIVYRVEDVPEVQWTEPSLNHLLDGQSLVVRTADKLPDRLGSSPKDVWLQVPSVQIE